MPVVAVSTVIVELLVSPDVSVTVEGLSVIVGPVGELEEVRVIVPENPPVLESVMVELDFKPDSSVIVDGVAEMEKSAAGAEKNSVMEVAPASLDVSVGRFQLVSIVFVNE